MSDQANEAEHEGGAEIGHAPLAPLRTKSRVSVVRIPNHWFVLATSDELRGTPLSRRLMNTPIVLYRDGDGRPRALLDRCPHRNVPLSAGRVHRDGTLECGYHGWRFDGEGRCRAVPGLAKEGESKGRHCPSYPVIESQGFIWVYSTAGAMPATQPHRFVHDGDLAYVTVKQSMRQEATLYSCLENALDVPHTAFLHRGLFRGESRGTVLRVVVKRDASSVEAEFIGESRPPGLMARVLSPSGGAVQHWDRFIMPCIAQVEYRMGDENHVLAETAMTPISDFETMLYGVVSFRTRLPMKALRPLVQPVAERVLRQDAEMLAKQTATVRAFGGEQFISTEIDILGRHIWRLLRAAERGETVEPHGPTELSLIV